MNTQLNVSNYFNTSCSVEKSFLRSRPVEESETAKRVVMQVPVTAQARSIIDGIKEETGVAKQEAIVRILEWFASQTRNVRREILDKNGDAGAEITRVRMSEMNAAGHPDFRTVKSIEDAMGIISLMMERIKQIESARQTQFGVPAKGSGKKN